MSQSKGSPVQYLGDGVYASFDGWQIWLHVGSHYNPPVVALEPKVFSALVDYNKQIERMDQPET